MTNPADNPYTAEDVVLTDYPPAQVTLAQSVYNLGDIALGASVITEITGEVVGSWCYFEYSAIDVGYLGQFPVFSGGDRASFSIDFINGAEFPSALIPASMIICLLAGASYLRRKEE